MFTPLLTFALLNQSPLDGDPKLEAKITVECPARPMEELLAGISEKVGERVYAAPVIRNDVVVMLAKDLPAKEVLGMLSTHFSWSWERTAEGLRIFRSQKQQSDEEKAARESLLVSYRRWREASQQALKNKTNGETSEYQELLNQHRDLLDRYQSEYYGESKVVRDKWVADMDKNEARRAELSRSFGPQWRLYDEFVAGLSDDDMLNLDRSHRLVFSTKPTLWQRAMPSNVSALADRCIEFVAKSSGNREVDNMERIRDLVAETYTQFTPRDVSFMRIVLRQDFRVDPSAPGLIPFTQIGMFGANGAILANDYANPKMGRDRLINLPAPPEVQGLDEPLEETAYLKEAKKRERPNLDRMRSEMMAGFLKARSKDLPGSELAKDLVEVAKAAKVNFISDVYDSRGWLTRTTIPMNSKKAAFDLFAQKLSESWEFEGGWVKFRARNWQFARQNTVAADVLWWMRDRLVTEDFSFDAVADCSLRASDRQLSGPVLSELMRRSAWSVSERSDKSNYILRFWASTPKAMRARLLEGYSVRFSDLSADQRKYLSEFVYRQDDRSYDARIYALEQDGLEDADLTWLKANWPNFQNDNDGLSDQEPSQSLPNGIPMTAMVNVHKSSGNALIVSKGSWSMKLTEQEAITSGYYKPDSDEFQAVSVPETRMYFGIITSPDQGYGCQIGAIRPPADAKPISYADFPKETKDRLEKAYKARHGGG